MTVVRQDTFTRANQSGWGTASDGNTWAASGTQAIASNEGGIGTSAASTFSTLGAALSGADAEGLVRFSIGGSTDTAGILLRYTNSSNHWLFRYDGGGHVAAMVKVSGSYTTLSPSYTFTPTNGTFYWLRARCQGTTIEFKIWQDGTSEPSSWTESYTSSSQNVAGNVGLYGFGHGTNSVKFDTYSVDDLTGGTVSAGATISGKGGLSVSAVQHVAKGASITGQGKLVATASGIATGAATISGHGALAASAVQHVHAGAAITGKGTLVANPFPPGTAIGDITVTTDSVSWANGTNGAGSGTETRIAYKDASGTGWALGIWPSYGGGPVAAIYEIDNGVVSANQTSVDTTASDGHIHWLEQSGGGSFSGSEDVLFSNAGNLVEQAPTGTPFRSYWKAIGNGNDANGFAWTMWVCVYPGDPGFAFYRFDLHNPSGSAKSLASSDSLEIALLGGLQQDDTTWSPANGGYGQLSGADHVGWPASLTSIEPDYVYITPNPAIAGVHIGQATVKKTSLSGLGWSSLQTEYLQASGAADRLKLKVQGTYTSFPAGATQTVYLLGILRRSLNATDVRAMAAAYLSPGAPSLTTGTYTGWSDDEGAYVCAAGGAGGTALSLTLDMSPTGVTVRYKPVFKITGWTGGVPALTWGGSALIAGQDYRHYEDTTNHVLYVQLYFDVVASGATQGQRNDAALAITGSVLSGAATLAGQGAVRANAVQHVAKGATISGKGALVASAVQHVAKAATLTGHGSLVASVTQHVTGAAAVKGHGSLVASGVQHVLGAASVKGQGKLAVSVVQHVAKGATIPGRGLLIAAAVQHVSVRVTLRGQGAIVAGGVIQGQARAILTGQGALAVSGVQHVAKGVSVTGKGGLAATGVQHVAGAATISARGRAVASAVQHLSAARIAFIGMGAISATPAGLKPYHTPMGVTVARVSAPQPTGSTILTTSDAPDVGVTLLRVTEPVGSTSRE